MLISAFPAGPLAANCSVVAAAEGGECVVVDPGQDAADGVAKLVAEHGLTPVAVLLTHGHFDHVWSAARVCAAYGIAAHIHSADRELLTDPAKGLDPALADRLAELFGGENPGEPDELVELSGGEVLPFGGLGLAVDHAPGHTPGSVTFTLPAAADRPEVMFAGDLLFAGSIGRTDFPGGDHEAMLRSLERVCLRRSDDTVVLPGHGPQTTIGAERTGNPFLRGL
ncbi:glyoxylase-like metal-dependent hydrolase (beta-lactamase superfamily II) [Murinocardiopsis flavida]|uniref:Glyoxylase-like metal-dependent hydrolase (Beta-lactamase superfamily II) n=1 Tax=Murinocardiopsis flavida TaxID=645275 RepID=A0A2P8DKA9_9ACTN|nr:MBL fold metallo-hydrolase [Murinocardiopsis flavida]PSK97655.1 glyoxylase-like metal-dependent hydrolase (beta-lactamase superfamily II) [Murinocardiopsis flavida]